MNLESTDILKEFNLRHTDCREEVLSVFDRNHTALSHGDLEEQVNQKYDRVTIYRTLKTFLEKGLLHKVLDGDGGTRYALCKNDCKTDDHHHDHVHFKCDTCGNTTCLDHVHIPALKLPDGYTRQEINLLVQGVCPACQ